MNRNLSKQFSSLQAQYTFPLVQGSSDDILEDVLNQGIHLAYQQ